MSTTKQLTLTSKKALKALFKNVNVSTPSGLPLYARDEDIDAFVIALNVKESKAGNLYFMAINPINSDELLVSTPPRYYDMLQDNEFEDGDVITAEVYFRKPIEDISDTDLAARYAGKATVVANYKAALANEESHLYVSSLEMPEED